MSTKIEYTLEGFLLHATPDTQDTMKLVYLKPNEYRRLCEYMDNRQYTCMLTIEEQVLFALLVLEAEEN